MSLSYDLDEPNCCAFGAACSVLYHVRTRFLPFGDHFQTDLFLETQFDHLHISDYTKHLDLAVTELPLVQGLQENSRGQ